VLHSTKIVLSFVLSNNKSKNNLKTTIMKRVINITNIIGLLILIPGLFIGYLSHQGDSNTNEENTVKMDESGTSNTNVLNRSVRFSNF